MPDVEATTPPGSDIAIFDPIPTTDWGLVAVGIGAIAFVTASFFLAIHHAGRATRHRSRAELR